MPKRRMTPARKAAIAKWQRAGANSRKGNSNNRIQKWSAAELSAPRRIPKNIQQEINHINDLKRKVGWRALDSQKPVPTGKNITLMHYTTPERAARIVKEGFTTKHGTNTMYSNLKDANYMYGVLPVAAPKWSGFGKALVSVRVPRRMAKIDQSMNTYYPPPRRIAIRNLQGRKFKRHK